jgi:hypothetical protein
MKKLLVGLLALGSISSFAYELSEVSMNYSCQLKGSNLVNFDKKIKSGTLLLKDIEVLGQAATIPFVKFNSICIKLSRWKTINDIAMTTYNCKDVDYLGNISKAISFGNMRIGEGAVIINKIKSKNGILKKQASLECTFTNVNY